jgi:hypothetical protein
MCEQTTIDRLCEIMRDMPEESVAEVLDFAEFLKARHGQDETAYLLREPANARRLLDAAANIRAGRNIQERELLPDD